MMQIFPGGLTSSIMPNTHSRRRRRRDATVELRHVSVGDVYWA